MKKIKTLQLSRVLVPSSYLIQASHRILHAQLQNIPKYRNGRWSRREVPGPPRPQHNQQQETGSDTEQKECPHHLRNLLLRVQHTAALIDWEGGKKDWPEIMA